MGIVTKYTVPIDNEENNRFLVRESGHNWRRSERQLLQTLGPVGLVIAKQCEKQDPSTPV
jgi:hypothetical protein